MWLKVTAQNTADTTDAQQEMEKPEQKAQQANIANQKAMLRAVTNPVSDCYGICKFTLLSQLDNVYRSCSHAANCHADILCMENLVTKIKKEKIHSQEDGYI